LLRTTSWQVTNDTYAYILGVGRRSVTSFGVEFGRGSNAASGSFQQLQFVEVPGITDSEVVVWLEVELIGSTLTVRRLDGTVVLTRSDSTHQAAGRVGVNYFRGSQGGPGLFTGFYFESLDPTSEYTDEAGDTYLQTLASSVIIPGTAPEGGAAVGGGTVSPGNDIRLTVGQLLATLGDAGASQATRVGSTAKWQAAKARGATNPARLAIVGDSNVAGQGSGTGADGLVGAATTSLARRFMVKKGVRTDSFFGEQNVTLANTGLASYDPRITLGTGWAPDSTVS
ncbi:hypothetical protein BFJ72_g15390, partial [Fusarium proliferatum]